MKLKFYINLVIIFLISLNTTLGQDSIFVSWKKLFAGSLDESVDIAIPSKDGGIIAAVNSESENGSFNLNMGLFDAWVFKMNNLGSITWRKRFGGSGHDKVNDIIEVESGGYILVGTTYSDIFLNDFDIWIFKINETGNLVWEKKMGGYGSDIAKSVKIDLHGNILVCGSSFSRTGVDIVNSHGLQDGILIKLDKDGNKIWSKCFGGSNMDDLFSLEIQGEYYILSGFDDSSDGDSPTLLSYLDFWTLKVDINGEIVWSRNFGGSDIDYTYKMRKTLDNGFLLIGCTNSNDGDLNGNYRIGDLWILKLDQNGHKEWSKVIDFGYYDEGIDIAEDLNGDFIVLIKTQNKISENSSIDYLVAKISRDLQQNIIWTLPFGGSMIDFPTSLFINSNNDLIITGKTYSSDFDIPSNSGHGDGIIIKLSKCKDILFFPNSINYEINDGIHLLQSSKNINFQNQIQNNTKVGINSNSIDLNPGFLANPSENSYLLINPINKCY